MNPHKPAVRPPAEYGAEVLCAGWNPVAAAAPGEAVSHRALPFAAAGPDPESFLPLFYSLQQT